MFQQLSSNYVKLFLIIGLCIYIKLCHFTLEVVRTFKEDIQEMIIKVAAKDLFLVGMFVRNGRG